MIPAQWDVLDDQCVRSILFWQHLNCIECQSEMKRTAAAALFLDLKQLLFL